MRSSSSSSGTGRRSSSPGAGWRAPCPTRPARRSSGTSSRPPSARAIMRAASRPASPPCSPPRRANIGGTGRTANDRQADDSNGGGIPWIFIVFIVLLIATRFFRLRLGGGAHDLYRRGLGRGRLWRWRFRRRRRLWRGRRRFSAAGAEVRPAAAREEAGSHETPPFSQPGRARPGPPGHPGGGTGGLPRTSSSTSAATARTIR